MPSLRIKMRLSARTSLLGVATNLALMGASLSPFGLAYAQVTFGGVEVAPGLSVGGTTIHPDGTTTIGGIQAGGIRGAPGMQFGGSTLGGYNPERERRENEERDRQRRTEEENTERRRRNDEDFQRRVRESEDQTRRDRRQAEDIANERMARRQSVERGQFQEPFKNLSFRMEVLTSALACGDQPALDCWRRIVQEPNLGTQMLSIQNPERAQDEIAFLVQRHAIQLELADRQASGLSRICDINDCNGNPDLLRHGRRQSQNFKLAYDEFFRNFRVPASFHQLARRHGITDLRITFRLLLTRDRLIDAMLVEDASRVSLGERSSITNLVANSNELTAAQSNFAIFQILNDQFPEQIRSAIQRVGFPSAPSSSPTPAATGRPRR